MPEDRIGGPAPLPRAALAGMAGWRQELVWRMMAERVTWRLRSPAGEVRYLKVVPFNLAQELADERDRLRWARAYLPVPEVVSSGSDGTHEWLLTRAIPSVDATDARLRADPSRLVPQLARALRRFHEAPIEGCPFDSRLVVQLPLARQRVRDGVAAAEGPLRPEHGVTGYEAALERLEALMPDGPEDLVVCHGDFCLPNVLFDADRLSGYVDLGHLGVADRWWDLAVATWSVTWNLGTRWEDLFLESYGAPRDERKQAFYRLLYDLLP